MEKSLSWAIEIQSLAQAGLAYSDNPYDEDGYQTPKIDTRAAIFGV